MSSLSRKAVVCFLVFVLWSFALLEAQDASKQLPEAEADRLYQAENWGSAVDAYEGITNREPTNQRAWYRLGMCLYRLEKYRKAVSAFEKAEQNGVPRQIVGYNLAAMYALLGEKEKAFEWMEKAIDAGFAQVDQLKSDADLANLREDGRFKEAVRKTDINARPCELLPEYRQFDFWVGDWDVSAGGQIAGENSIQRVVEGCILLENWTSVAGGSGKSINYYDPGKRKWIQIWVDSGGGLVEAEGELEDGSMDFRGKHTYRDGRVEQYRMKFTPLEDGKVRQFIEQSRDGGETWYVWFDGTYTKKQ
jgi:hypothetical protein